MTYVTRMSDDGDRETVLNDLLAFVRERRARPGTSAAAAEILEAIEQRIEIELAMP